MVDRAEIIRERLELAFQETGKRPTDLADFCDVTEQAVSKWRRTGKIARDHLPRVSEFFGKSIAWLMGEDGVKESIFPYGAKLRPIAESARQVPVINYIQAGHPKEVVDDYATGNGFDTVTIDIELAAKLGSHAFALVIEGDSMLPDFRPGDTVIIDPSAPIRPGDIVVAKIERDKAATLKKYRSRGQDENGHDIFELVPLNDNYPTILVNASNPGRTIGRVVEHRRRFI